MERKTIIYISGDGHSGSTILDIVLGSQNRAFSTGELIFIAQKGIQNREYCACGNPVPECEIWSSVINKWEKERFLKLDKYIEIQRFLNSNKKIASSYFLLKNPKDDILHFINDTEVLYNIIFEVTNSDIIIDSSKTPNNLLVLKKMKFDLKIIHLIRRFGDVLNSNKKEAKKDLEAGVEHDIIPQKTSYVFVNWILKNIMTIAYSRGVPYHKLHYEDIVKNPVESLTTFSNNDKGFINKLENRGPFYSNHLVAGNAIRMKDHMYIAKKPMNTSYSRLRKIDKFLAMCIDSFYK